MSLINNNYILINEKFKYLCKFSFRLSPSEKNIFWNLIFAQGHIPSLNLENFLKFCVELLNNPPTNLLRDENIKIDCDEFFDKVINSILILFKKEIYGNINKNELEVLSKKCTFMFNFDSVLKNYIYQMIDAFLNNFFLNNNVSKKLFYYMVEQYYKENISNRNNLRKLAELLNYFLKCQQDINNNNNRDKNNNDNIGWIPDNIKTLINNIMKTINQLSN